jgi:hypothetical protein
MADQRAGNAVAALAVKCTITAVMAGLDPAIHVFFALRK